MEVCNCKKRANEIALFTTYAKYAPNQICPKLMITYTMGEIGHGISC